jgi:hypothetical protein
MGWNEVVRKDLSLWSETEQSMSSAMMRRVPVISVLIQDIRQTTASESESRPGGLAYASQRAYFYP